MGLRHRCGRLILLIVDRRREFEVRGRKRLGAQKSSIIPLVSKIWVGFAEHYTPGKNHKWSFFYEQSLSSGILSCVDGCLDYACDGDFLKKGICIVFFYRCHRNKKPKIPHQGIKRLEIPLCILPSSHSSR